MRPRAIGGVCLLACAALATGCRDAQPQDRPAPAPAAAAAAYDHDLTDIARLLAGMPPNDPAGFTNVTGRQSWQDYHAAIDEQWANERGDRFQTIAAWRDDALAGPVAACRTLFYPFSGPDILHAELFFPRCARYVLFGLEHLGTVPRLDQLSPARVDRLVGELQASLADLFTRHYFITRDMMTELTESDLDGVTPLILLLLARLDARIVSVDRVALTDTGEAIPLAAADPTQGKERLLEGSRVTFLPVGAAEARRVIYFRAPTDNRSLAARPIVAAYIRGLAPATTFIKSASYLLHTESFSTIRSLIVDTSSVILEDDSGVPYRFLSSPPWHVSLFGRYEKPIADFNYGFQRDLEAAYDRAGVAAPLPFTFGYHWRDGSSGVILAVRGH